MKRKDFIRNAFVLGLIFSLASSASIGLSQDAKQSERLSMFYRYLRFASLVKGGSIQPHWMADGNSFWYAEGFPDKTVVYKVDPKANAKELLFDTERLRQALTPLMRHELPYKGLPFKEFTFVDGEKAIKFSVEGKEFICQLDTYKISAVPPLSKDEKSRSVPRFVREGIMAGSPDVMEVLSPDRRWFLGAKNHNLYLRSTSDGRSEPLSTDGIKDYEWDVQGARWSPDSFKVGTLKIDSRKVLLVPLVHWLKPTEQVEWRHFTKAGGPMPQIELFIVNILSKEQVRVDTGREPDQYIFILSWRPDGSELLFIRMNRTWKKLELMAADPETGSSRIILTESQKTFVLPLGRSGSGFTLFKDGKRFIWISERDGWAHLYLYDINGTLIKKLTKGNFPVVRITAVDEKEGWVYFTAHAEKRIYDTHLYRVNFEGKGYKRLTELPGQHDVSPYLSSLFGYYVGIQFSPSRKFFLDTHSSADRPPRVELRKADGTLLQTLSKANIDELKALKWKPPEEFVVKAADKKTDLYGILYKPYDFDPNKKYPVIDSIYNGPQTTTVPRTFIDSWSIIPQGLAQLGFIVFVVDGRGTPERGKEFQDVVYGNFGRNEIPDHVSALKQLAEERPYMDLTKVGILGGSWGGYMTVRAMVLAPDVYHVAVASYPVVDLYDQMALAIEPYMGLPQGNREGYEYGSSLRLADELKGKLLLIHGTSDVNATFSATMKMVEALIRAGKPVDLIVMPDQDHSISGKSAVYRIEATRRYFQEHLCNK